MIHDLRIFSTDNKKTTEKHIHAFSPNFLFIHEIRLKCLFENCVKCHLNGSDWSFWHPDFKNSNWWVESWKTHNFVNMIQSMYLWAPRVGVNTCDCVWVSAPKNLTFEWFVQLTPFNWVCLLHFNIIAMHSSSATSWLFSQEIFQRLQGFADHNLWCKYTSIYIYTYSH